LYLNIPPEITPSINILKPFKIFKEIGFNVQIETLDPNVLRQQLSQGQFQMNTGIWVGGNQDPIFFRDLFSTAKIPNEKTKVSCCNRSRYSNPEFDALSNRHLTKPTAKSQRALFQSAGNNQPRFAAVSALVSGKYGRFNKRVGNIKISPSGDWSFIKDVTVAN
jgi:ABC-type transport system substrate-binding protein